MENYKVLITTSGIGSRLGRLTNKTNKCLVRIADKPSISYIVESYPIDTDFVITLGHFGEYVRQYLTMAYPDRNFTFIEVDIYDGEGSSLGYSILKCKDVLQCPFIFHASDTMIINNTLPIPTENWMAGTYKRDSSHYRTLLVKDGLIDDVYDKGAINYDYIYIGLCGINNYKLFFEILDQIVNSNESDLSDVHVISEMLKDNKFQYKNINHSDWYDIGNIGELNRTRDFLESNIEVLDKTDESIYFFDDFVIKFFSDTLINENRVKRGKILKYLVPEILDYSDNFYKYKKVRGNLFSRTVNTTSFINFLNWSKANLWKSISSDINANCYNFYINKTKSRVQKYLSGREDKETIINGDIVPPVHLLVDKIDSEWISNGIPVQFHGDFILDNIIETKDGFSLIDWRQDFDGDINVGDIYYDLAKLNHNLTVNHDIVGKNLFSKDENNCYILTNSILNECREILHKFILDNNYDLNKVEVLTSLIWINMAPLHEYPFSEFLFNYGKYTLNKKLK